MKPLLITREIITRIIASALHDVGLSEVNANILASVHTEHVDRRAEAWSGWLSQNCLSCKYNTETCKFFSPDAETDVSAEDVKESHLRLVEMAWDPCPLRESESEQ
mgnify:CR=1 FL=1